MGHAAHQGLLEQQWGRPPAPAVRWDLGRHRLRLGGSSPGRPLQPAAARPPGQKTLPPSGHLCPSPRPPGSGAPRSTRACGLGSHTSHATRLPPPAVADLPPAPPTGLLGVWPAWGVLWGVLWGALRRPQPVPGLHVPQHPRGHPRSPPRLLQGPPGSRPSKQKVRATRSRSQFLEAASPFGPTELSPPRPAAPAPWPGGRASPSPPPRSVFSLGSESPRGAPQAVEWLSVPRHLASVSVAPPPHLPVPPQTPPVPPLPARPTPGVTQFWALLPLLHHRWLPVVLLGLWGGWGGAAVGVEPTP